MPQVKIGIQLAGLQQPFKKALHTAARLGAAGVEIDLRNELPATELSESGIRQIRKMLDDLNLRVAAAAFPTRRGYEVSEDLDRRLAATKEAMRLVYALGGACLINSVGRIPADASDPQWNTLVECLTDLGRYSHHVGVVLAARTGGEAPADLARLIAALPEGALAVDFNPGSLILGGYSPQAALVELAGKVAHVHAQDGVRDRAQGRGVEVPLGRGEADFPMLLGLLHEQGYRGWYTIERRSAADPQAEFAAAVKYLKAM